MTRCSSPARTDQVKSKLVRPHLKRQFNAMSDQIGPPPLQPSQLSPLTGDEQFEFGASILDFWKWSLGDLRMNTARGLLVEFFVAKAAGSTAPIRVEWADYDVEAADGTRIEIKASGYLQSWGQKQVSIPTYSFKSAFAETEWDALAGDYVPTDPETRVDVWVFALQTCIEPSRYDPLDMAQWEFRVAPQRLLFGSGQKSAGLSFFERNGIEAVSFDGLQPAILGARAENERLAAER